MKLIEETKIKRQGLKKALSKVNQSLNRWLQSDAPVKLKFKSTGPHRYEARLQVRWRGKVLSGSGHGSNYVGALFNARDALKVQMRKRKKRIQKVLPRLAHLEAG